MADSLFWIVHKNIDEGFSIFNLEIKMVSIALLGYLYMFVSVLYIENNIKLVLYRLWKYCTYTKKNIRIRTALHIEMMHTSSMKNSLCNGFEDKFQDKVLNVGTIWWQLGFSIVNGSQKKIYQPNVLTLFWFFFFIVIKINSVN
jgi:hypothetical protein